MIESKTYSILEMKFDLPDHIFISMFFFVAVSLCELNFKYEQRLKDYLFYIAYVNLFNSYNKADIFHFKDDKSIHENTFPYVGKRFKYSVPVSQNTPRFLLQ